MITKDSISLNLEQPFLSNEAFDCSRKISCTKVAQNNGLDKEGEPISVAFSMRKIHGLFKLYFDFSIYDDSIEDS